MWNLTLSEATVIAGITQNPSKYNPITHPDYNKERRTKVLTRMVEQGYITQADMDEAEADNVYDRIAAAQEAEAISTVYTYFVDELTKQVVNDLMDQKGYTETRLTSCFIPAVSAFIRHRINPYSPSATRNTPIPQTFRTVRNTAWTGHYEHPEI